MEITEKHLQDVLDEVEKDAIENAKSSDEEYGRIFGARSMQLKLRCILNAKSEEDLKFRKEFSKECMRMLILGNGDITSATYRCGHPINPIVINTTPYSLAMYMEWRSDPNRPCIECWLKQNEEKKL